MILYAELFRSRYNRWKLHRRSLYDSSTNTNSQSSTPADPFIGREPEITEIVGLLNDASCRLLTLLGSGGIGKTRLSIESIRRLTDNNFEHGVFYVPLAPLTSADNIVTTVIGDEGTPQEELVKFLSHCNLLLVIDNFEHVLDGADLVANILSVTPNVKILVTSREALNLQQEWVWHVKLYLTICGTYSWRMNKAYSQDYRYFAVDLHWMQLKELPMQI
jgi:hypothetical protein